MLADIAIVSARYLGQAAKALDANHNQSSIPVLLLKVNAGLDQLSIYL